VRGRAMTVRRHTTPSFAVRTNRSWEAVRASLSSRTRRWLDTADGKTTRDAGEPRVEMLKPGPDEVDRVLDLLVAVEATGWKGREGSALAARPDLQGFFREYARRASQHRHIRVAVLRIGDDVAAVELGIEAHGRVWGLKVAYDERFARSSPALQLIHASIRAADENGRTADEFLGSGESWQQRWKPERRDYVLTVLYPLSARAAVTAAYDLVSFAARRLSSPMRVEVVTA